MVFAYYARLTRAQQAIYRKSDALTEVRLERPADLHPRVAALETALKAEDRAATQAASRALIRGLTDAMGLPPVEVTVLAARPHARWGELHGLYTNERGKPPKIQLWMRTAKQKRVVAFRTFLRTLLHEVGHHVDYTGLRLKDSFHTEGFYKRESSLFYQLVPERRTVMVTIEERLKLPPEANLERMERTATDLAAAIKGQREAALSRRPDPKNWAAKEVVCHLRDTEEVFMGRFQTILSMDEPKLLAPAPDLADRWAEERQYLRCDAERALEAFRKRREEALAFLRNLGPSDWQRGGLHAVRGRMTIGDWVAVMAWHDDNHLDQLQRALEGRA
ncbi:MAG: hypothetical protein DME12_07970 [Candidatus Rokuibacteriota bacterium]|nr:MAG: hypothetical protein DME12_07970 [Candidatus Rokubacteria bacterium]PYN67960.1 MAG: hypothetical protein DMD93_12230 [Candidatus Rokubacteria bacterium]